MGEYRGKGQGRGVLGGLAGASLAFDVTLSSREGCKNSGLSDWRRCRELMDFSGCEPNHCGDFRCTQGTKRPRNTMMLNSGTTGGGYREIKKFKN